MRTRVFEIAEQEGCVGVNALARRMGVAPSTISRVQRGKAVISVEFIEAARRAFPGYSLDELFPPDDVKVPA